MGLGAKNEVNRKAAQEVLMTILKELCTCTQTRRSPEKAGSNFDIICRQETRTCLRNKDTLMKQGHAAGNKGMLQEKRTFSNRSARLYSPYKAPRQGTTASEPSST